MANAAFRELYSRNRFWWFTNQTSSYEHVVVSSSPLIVTWSSRSNLITYRGYTMVTLDLYSLYLLRWRIFLYLWYFETFLQPVPLIVSLASETISTQWQPSGRRCWYQCRLFTPSKEPSGWSSGITTADIHSHKHNLYRGEPDFVSRLPRYKAIITYAAVPANISIRFACVIKAKTNENIAVKAATMPSRAGRFDTKYKMTIDEIGNKEAKMVPRIWMKLIKYVSEYCVIPASGSSASGFYLYWVTGFWEFGV